MSREKYLRAKSLLYALYATHHCAAVLRRAEAIVHRMANRAFEESR
jgi:hypothetical protein